MAQFDIFNLTGEVLYLIEGSEAQAARLIARLRGQKNLLDMIPHEATPKPPALGSIHFDGSGQMIFQPCFDAPQWSIAEPVANQVYYAHSVHQVMVKSGAQLFITVNAFDRFGERCTVKKLTAMVVNTHRYTIAAGVVVNTNPYTIAAEYTGNQSYRTTVRHTPEQDDDTPFYLAGFRYQGECALIEVRYDVREA